MSLKIETGKFKNKYIETVNDPKTRYTTSMLRQALMNMFDFNGAIILELFAGSGIFSFEALSNGAQKSVLVDISSKSVKSILENAKTLHVLKNIRVIKSDYRKVFSKLSSERFDFIFADPPFNLGYIDELLKLLDKNFYILEEEGYIIIEKAKNENFIGAFENLTLVETRDYGDVELLILQRIKVE
ncbi:MAG TPA: 16S rRNA (guanine(966)-N(2))-methyltransferase RsmD [Defluviitoga sp.]|nr:16S rRNA (guanine(966)-N(2))-methyltransferase RsmD [Defluviitoga sp.]HOP24307.1 16S rRNA (guanine(966)-N(2))-methyltransferase RsmD [Defluviitoga sp.]HPZ28101.1 16S rRNA (guanine(966)-N(2))-methyltransferase RsmD [Defluviitoga sp.]HQD61991.1 16S rRNA (guanine(966)-N(2))-methyltransferase RsmD [Defluviitoga sp.]